MSSGVFSRSMFVVLVLVLSFAGIGVAAVDVCDKNSISQPGEKGENKPRFTNKNFQIDRTKAAEHLTTKTKFNGKDSFWWQNFRKAYSQSEFVFSQIDQDKQELPEKSELDNARSAAGNKILGGINAREGITNKVETKIGRGGFKNILAPKNHRGKIIDGELPVNPSFSAVSIASIKGELVPDASTYKNLLRKSKSNKKRKQAVADLMLSVDKLSLSETNQFDMYDFSLIAENWLNIGESIEGDFDDDNKVGVTDLKYLAENWLAEETQIDMSFSFINILSSDPNDPNSTSDPNIPDPVEDPNSSLYYADDLPYQTSFEALQGYVFDNQNSINNPFSIDGQNGWCVESGDFGVINSPTMYFDGPIEEINNPDYYFEGTQSVLYSGEGGECYKEFNDNGDNRFVRFEIWPAHNSEFIIADGDEIVAAIKFNFDESIYDPNDPNTAAENIFYWEPDPNEGDPGYVDTGVSYTLIHRVVYNNMGPVRTKFMLDIDWENESYDVYWANPFTYFSSYELLGWNIPLSKGTFDRIKLVNSGDESLVFDRLLVCDDDFDSVVVEIDSPCHCDYQEGGLAKALTPVMGRYMGYDTAGYSILCCPKDDGDMNWFEDWEELAQSFIENKWVVSDVRSELVPEANSQLGWWRTGMIPNGYYYWSVLVYSDITTSSGYMLPWYCYWLNDSRTIEGTGETYEVWPVATIPVAGYQKSNPYTTEYSTAIKVEWPGEFPFELKHYYNSGRATKIRPFYYGWSCNYEYTLAEDTRFQYESEFQTFLGDVPYHDDNYLGYGLISIQFPDGTGHVFRRRENAGNSSSSESIYYPYPEVNGRDYVKRETYSTIESGTYYINRIRYTLVTGDGKELVFEEDNLNVEMDSSGTVGWLSEPVFERISDRFGNSLNVNWVGDRIDSVSYGQGEIEKRIQFYDDNNNGLIEKALLLVGGDEDNPLRIVKYGINYYPHGYYSELYSRHMKEFCIKEYNNAVDDRGIACWPAEETYKAYYAGYHPENRQHVIYEFNKDYWWEAYIDKIDIFYDDWGRVTGLFYPADYEVVIASNIKYPVIRGSISIFEYNYYLPDPNNSGTEGRWQEITHINTEGEFSYVPDELYIRYATFAGTTTVTKKDYDGRVHSSNMATINDCGEKLTEYKYEDSTNYYKPTEIREVFDGKERISDFTYDFNGDLIEKEVKQQGSSEIKKETYTWHQAYEFPTSQSTWQIYGDDSTEIRTEYVYGRANGTVSGDSLENKYLIKQRKLIDYNDADPNDSEWAITSYLYRNDGQIQEVIDPENKRQTMEYDDWGYLSAVFYGDLENEVPVRRQINNSIGEVEMEVNSFGRLTVNTIDGNGRIYQKDIYECRRALWHLSDPNFCVNYSEKQGVLRYGYNLRDQLTCEYSVDYGLDEKNYKYTQYYSSGQPANMFYKIPDSTNSNYGATEAYEVYMYDHKGRLWQHYWLDHYSRDDTDAIRLEVQLYDDLNRCTNKYRYDYYDGEDTQIEEAIVYRKIVAYNTEGQPVLQKLYGNEILETTVSYNYDIFGRKISAITDPVIAGDPNSVGGLSLETKFYYDLADNTIKTEDPKGNITYFTYDNANRKVNDYFAAANGTAIENAVVSSKLEYYANGQLMESTIYDRDGSTVLEHAFLSYDDQNRIIQVDKDVDASSVATTSIYYNDGVPAADPNYFTGYEEYDVRILDAENKSSWRQLDYNGQITEFLYSSGLSQQMKYYADGKLKARAVWSNTGQKLWVEYLRDGRGRLVNKRYPDGRCVKYSYDGFGRQLTQGRYIEGDDSDPNNIIPDVTLAEYKYTYDVFGRVSSVEDTDGFVSYYGYRGDGQLESINITDDPENDPNGFYQAYFAYDRVGRNAGLFTGPGTSDLAYSCIYDDNGNLENIGYHNGSSQPFAEIDYGFNLDNQLTGIDSSCYDLANVAIDGLGRITGGSEWLTMPGNSTVVNSLSFGYNRQGSLTSSNIGSWTGSYDYYRDGNIENRTENGLSEDFGYDFDGDGYDESNMLTSVGGNDLVDWDDNGNLVCDGVSSFEYNYDNKMYGASCIAEPNIFVAVGYDCENNRVSRISGDANGNFTSRKYILDYSGGLPKVLVELEPDGSGWSVAARNYHYGDRLISSVDGIGSSRFYVHDRNGNVRNVIDSSGSVLNSYSYTPYGEDIAAQCAETVENRWKYTGQYEDREIGQYYLRARQYSPYLARFNGYDPVYGDYSEPFTLHQYLYCLNDPINKVDWTGENWNVPSLNAGAGGASGMAAMFANYGQAAQSFLSRMLMQAQIYCYRLNYFALNTSGKAWTQSLRTNLARVTGYMKDLQAHHILPQKFAQQFAQIFGDKNFINNPLFGTWVDPNKHARFSYSYNQAWQTFFDNFANPTKQQVYDYARTLADQFGFVTLF